MQPDSSKSQIFSDKPTSIDLLNFMDYAKILADIVADSETPTTIGVFGEWGSGKSSLLVMLDEILWFRNIKTIWFNAWKYDKEDALWRSLILRILEETDGKDKEVEEIREALYTAISTEGLGKTQINWMEIGKSLTKEGIKAVGTVAFPLAGIGTVFANLGKTFLNKTSIDEISKAITRETIKRSQERISSIEQFDKLYSKLIKKILGDKDRLVVFIDDLDRCNPLQSLLVLEALKSFLGADKCVYVVACDPRLIYKGFGGKYEKFTEKDARDYLEKIVQVYFDIPPLRQEDTELFLTKLGAGKDAKAITQIVMASLESNPRKIKRFLNSVEIQNRLVSARKLGIEKSVLIKLACITYGWKDLWIQVLDNPSLLTDLQKYAVDEDLENKIGANPLVQSIFERESKFKSFLKQKPYFSESDVDTYIFLARATQGGVSTTEVESEKTEQKAIRNPFVISPVSDMMFFNREDEFMKVEAMLNNKSGGALSIVGQRRIGKTSFLRQLEKMLRSPSVFPVYIDLQGYFGFVENTNNFFYLIAQSISRVMNAVLTDKGFLLVPTESQEMSPKEFEDFIQAIFTKYPSTRIVLLLDEFEMIFSRIAEGTLRPETLNYLRYLVSQFSEFKLVFCSFKTLPEIAKEQNIMSMTSPFYNIATVIKLNNFSRDASIRLIEEPIKDAIKYEKDALEYFVRQTGGHPYLIQFISSQIITMISGNSVSIVTRSDLENAIQNAQSQQIFHTTIKSNLPEDDLFEFAVALAHLSSQDDYSVTKNRIYSEMKPSFNDTEIIHHIQRLCDRGIILPSPNYQSAQKYTFSVPILMLTLLKYDSKVPL